MEEETRKKSLRRVIESNQHGAWGFMFRALLGDTGPTILRQEVESDSGGLEESSEDVAYLDEGNPTS